MSAPWKRSDTEKLIICVQQNECLYNVKSAEYLDRNKKAQAFNNILVEMKKDCSSRTLDDVKKKWNNLRTQYMQELRKINESKKSGSGRTDLYIPKLWCFDQLSFLKTHMNMRESEDNLDDTLEAVEPMSSLPDIENTDPNFCKEATPLTDCDGNNSSSCSENPPKKRAKTDGIRDNLVGIMSTIEKKNKKESKFEWLGKMVVPQIVDIEPEFQYDACWQVQCLMRDIMERKRNESTSSTSSFRDIHDLSVDELIEETPFYE